MSTADAEESKLEISSEVAETEIGADIAEYDIVASSEEGAVMEVRSPRDGEVMRHKDGRPFTIKFRGKDSEKFRNLARKQQDRRIQMNMRTRAPVLSVVVEKDDIELIVAATISWDIVLGGRVPKNDPKEYRAAYAKYPWLKRQGDEFVGVESNFIQDSSTS